MNTPTILIINLVILVVLGLIARTVKSDPTARGGFNFNYSTSDLVIMAVLGALAGVINTWMREKLSLLKLEADFINRILKSALDSARRFMESEHAGAKLGHIHILVVAPLGHKLEEKTWGFFRIEKLESTREAINPPDHYIEFHLYFEGE